MLTRPAVILIAKTPDVQRNTGCSEKGAGMPLINVRVIEGVFSDSQKRQMIEELTDAMVGIEGENMRPVTWVVVEEVKSGDWGIAGKPLATSDVKALAAGAPIG
jgi:4-oxalocrotonate tautomerase